MTNKRHTVRDVTACMALLPKSIIRDFASSKFLQFTTESIVFGSENVMVRGSGRRRERVTASRVWNGERGNSISEKLKSAAGSRNQGNTIDLGVRRPGANVAGMGRSDVCLERQSATDARTRAPHTNRRPRSEAAE